MLTPAFASYDGPSIGWVKRLAFDRAGGQEIPSTLHVGTHLAAPAHFPEEDYQVMHVALFPHDVIHIENLRGAIDEVLDRRIRFGCFPWRFQGGEAAFCRVVAFLE